MKKNKKNKKISRFSDKIFRLLAHLWYPFILLIWWGISAQADNKYIDLIFYAVIALNIYNLVCFVRLSVSSVQDNIRLKNQRLIVLIGSMGCGKTSRGMYLAVKQARKNWKFLQAEYFALKRRLPTYTKKNDLKKIAHFEEIKTAFDYWKKAKTIPCLYSNIPILVDGKYASQLSISHFYQDLKLLYRSVLFVDEAGTWFSQNDYKVQFFKDKRVYLSDTVRLIRHFIDGHIIMTEQDSGSLDIEVRRRTAINIVMYQQIWVLRSFALYYFYLFSRRFLPYFIEKFIHNLYIRVGYRRYTWDEEANTERTQAVQIRGQDFDYDKSFTPALLNFYYDDRTFRNAYFAEKKPFNVKDFDHLVLSFDELVELGYLRHYTAEAIEKHSAEHSK